MAQLVKHPYRICEVLGSNAHENDQFFSLCEETSKYGFGCKYFFSKTIRIWTIGTHFLNYRNIEYRTDKLGKLSDNWISNTKLKLSGYRISDIKKLSIALLCTYRHTILQQSTKEMNYQIYINRPPKIPGQLWKYTHPQILRLQP